MADSKFVVVAPEGNPRARGMSSVDEIAQVSHGSSRRRSVLLGHVLTTAAARTWHTYIAPFLADTGDMPADVAAWVPASPHTSVYLTS